MPRNVFISPHPDDAIWSCGGRISSLLQAKEPVLLITVFTARQVVVQHNERWRSIANSDIRLKENQKAIEFLNLENINLDYLDAALRLKEERYLYKDSNSLFLNMHEDDKLLIESIANSLVKILKPGDVVNVPLANGNHIDHLIVKEAAKKIGSTCLISYEDFPYSITESRPIGLKPHWFSVDIEVWIQAGLYYRSQIFYLFKNATNFKKELYAYAQLRGSEVNKDFAERCWI